MDQLTDGLTFYLEHIIQGASLDCTLKDMQPFLSPQSPMKYTILKYLKIYQYIINLIKLNLKLIYSFHLKHYDKNFCH